MTAAGEWVDVASTLDGVRLAHRARAGETPLLMVHGIGPGSSGLANFAPLLEALDGRFALHLIDLAGFGASGRKAAPPFFDVPFWLRQLDLAIDASLGSNPRAPIVVGNSVGAVLALKAAARRPEITRVLAIGAPAGPPAPSALQAFWAAPRDAQALATAMRAMTAAEVEPDAELVRARLRPFLLDDGYSDYFDAMLADPDDCLEAAVLSEAEASALSSGRVAVALMHGRQDRACLASRLIAEVAPRLADADLILLGGCGHNVIAERPLEVLSTISRMATKSLLQ